MYHNPSARHWDSHHHDDPAVLELHRKLPQYAETPLRKLPDSVAAELHVKHVFYKDESNRFGLPAFKVLGASWASYRAVTLALSLPATTGFEDVRQAAEGKGIVLHAATEGNFGRAVAHMASLMGVTAKIFVPKIMVAETRRLIAGEGAEVHVVDGIYDDAVREARRQAEALTGGILVQDDAWPGYEEIPQFVADGYSTMMLEVDRQVEAAVGQAPDLVVVPVGVGSLGQAAVVHFKSKKPLSLILTVEPDTAACLKSSLEKGERVTVKTADTNMCGMNCGTVSYRAWPILQKGVDLSIDVTDDEAREASTRLTDFGIMAGPCSAGTFAGAYKFANARRKPDLLGQDAVIVILGTEGPRNWRD